MKQRRSHSKVNKLPNDLREAINDAIVNQRLTYAQITEMITKAGHDISSKSVERYGKKFLANLESINRAKEQAKSILETSAGLKLDMAEASSTVAFQLLFDMLINTTGIKDEAGEPTAVLSQHALAAIKTLASLERSAVSREKLKYEFHKGVEAAAAKIKDSLKAELKNHPELVAQINEIVERAESDLKTK